MQHAEVNKGRTTRRINALGKHVGREDVLRIANTHKVLLVMVIRLDDTNH
jgi:citrate lyase beta subunit